MKLNSKKIGPGVAFVNLAALCLLIFFLLPIIPSQRENYAIDNSVTISNLHISSKASLENKFDVTETFDVTFNQYGLREVVRFIPYAGYNYRREGTNVDKKLYISRIQNAKGRGWNSEEFNLYTDEQSGFLTFGLKCPEGYFTRGETRHYQISYTYDCGKGTNGGFDDLYFNLIGTSSPMEILNVSFEVELPKISAENISIYYGKAGETATLPYDYDEENFVVSGSLSKLAPYEGITLRAVYKDGTIVANSNFSLAALLGLCLSLLTLALCLVYFFCFAQNRKLAVPVEVITPEGLNPYRADFFVSGNCSSKNLISCLLVLANKGYVALNQLENDDVEIVSLKEPSIAEETVLKSVYKFFFREKTKIKLSDFDKMSTVEMTEHAAQSKAISNSEITKSKDFLYEKKPLKIKRNFNILILIAFVAMVLCAVFAAFFFFGFFSDLYTIKFLLLGVTVILFGVATILNLPFIFKTILFASILAMTLGLYLMFGFAAIDGFYLLIGMVVFMLPSVILLSFDGKYTKEGAVAKGRALGFKKYIEMCEVEKLKMFAEENPNLFFDVLPYAYSFGLTDVWIKKFETIPLDMPAWLASNNGSLSDLVLLSIVLNNLDTRTSRIVNFAKTPGSGHFGGGGISFGGGSFGGGGFSGGGFGGGGFGAR